MLRLFVARWLYFLFLFSYTAAAIPRIAFPFNSQVPTIARVGQPYSFTFSPTTFANDGEPLDYSLQNAPAWLSIDPGSRTLYGTPGSADVGFPAFSIIAFDSTGRTPSPATLVVVGADHPLPTVNADLQTILAQGGRLGSSTTLLTVPRAKFGFSFPEQDFTYVGGPLTFYATLADHTPLPSWLSFDANHLQMSGTPPVLSASPQYFEVLLIASDVPGFAAVWVSFTIVVSVHSFHFKEIETTATAKPGDSFDLSHLQDDLILDDQPVKKGDITKSAAQHPTWLKFDQETLTFDGMPPRDFSDGRISVQAWNRFGDIANTTILLRATTGLLSTRFPPIVAIKGADFKYTFEDTLFKASDLSISLDVGAASTWLHFDPATKILTGKVPSDAKSPVQVEMTAKTADGATSDTRQFDIDVQSQKLSPTQSTATSDKISTSTATGGVFAATGTPESTNTGRTVGMVIGIVMAIVGVICFLVFVVWYRRYGRQDGKRKSPKKSSIGKPHYHDNNPWSADMDDEDLEKGNDELRRTADRPPQVHIKIPNISPFKKSRQSRTPRFPTIMPVPPTPVIPQEMARRSHARGQSLASSTIHGLDIQILENINRSSFGYNGTQKPHDSMRLPTEMARQSRITDLSNGMTPDNKRVSRYASSTRLDMDRMQKITPMRVVSGNLPVGRRVSGLGHGRSPSNRNSLGNLLQLQQQDRTPSYADSVTTHSTSVLFSPKTPAPPPHPSRNSSYIGIQQSGTRVDNMNQPRTLSAQRPISRRAPHRSAFFSARAHSRGSSSSRQRGTILGLPPINASPDLREDMNTMQDETTNGLGITMSTESSQPLTNADMYHPLRRNPTMTSEKTVTTFRTFDTATDVSELPSAPPLPSRHPMHKRWSSQFKARLSRPISGVLSESSRFADVDIDDPPTMSGANVVVLEDDDASLYSQSSRSMSIFHSATPSPERERPMTRGKIPVGGVRVPPFTDPGRSNAMTSIMNRPHPRVSIRKTSYQKPESPPKRMPLGKARGAENRLSGGGSFGLDMITLRPARLKSSKEKRPVSVNDGLEGKIRSVKGSVMSGRAGSNKSARPMSMSPMRGNECFL